MDKRYEAARTIRANVKIAGLNRSQEYLGEDYAHSNEDWAVKLQEAGAPFAWIAYSFGDIPMWELHAGAVVGEGTVHVGLHCHKDAKPEYVRVVREVGEQFGSFHDSDKAREYQYNKDFNQYTEEDLREIGKVLGNVYVAMQSGLRQRGLIS